MSELGIRACRARRLSTGFTTLLRLVNWSLVIIKLFNAIFWLIEIPLNCADHPYCDHTHSLLLPWHSTFWWNSSAVFLGVYFQTSGWNLLISKCLTSRWDPNPIQIFGHVLLVWKYDILGHFSDMFHSSFEMFLFSYASLFNPPPI